MISKKALKEINKALHTAKIVAIRFVKQALSHLAIYQLLSGELFNSDEHFIVSARGWEILNEIEENKNPQS